MHSQILQTCLEWPLHFNQHSLLRRHSLIRLCLPQMLTSLMSVAPVWFSFLKEISLEIEIDSNRVSLDSDFCLQLCDFKEII